MKFYEKALCFCGCGPDEFRFPLKSDCPEYVGLQADITCTLVLAIQEKYTHFLCGMKPGFDLICAGIMLEIKDIEPKYNIATLVAVLPYPEHSLPGNWGDVHQGVLERADEVVTVSTWPHRMVDLEQSLYMVNRSDRVICYYDAHGLEKAYTVKYAANNGLQICNLHQER